MFSPHNFVYKRSRNGAHLARAHAVPTTPTTDTLNLSQVFASSFSEPKVTDPLIPVQQTTNNAPATSASPVLGDSPTQISSSSSVSTTPSASTSSTSTSSSRSSSTSSTISTQLVAETPINTAHRPLGTTQAFTGISFTPTSSSTASTASTTGTSGGASTGAIVGGVAGTLAGIAILGFLVMWCMRRQRSRDIDDFDALAFKRQSAMLVDDPVDSSRSYNARPPTMLEHHSVSPALATQVAYGGQNFYGNYGGYDQQPPSGPPEMIQPASDPTPQAYGAPPTGYTGYGDPQHQIVRQPSSGGYGDYNTLARQPSNAQYLTRQPSSAAGYASAAVPPGSVDTNTSYIDLNRSSVSPYQAAQYADISRRLGAPDPNEKAPKGSDALPDGPLPSPFDDPVETIHPSGLPAPGRVAAAPAPQSQASAQRPPTVYDEGDAYGGI